MNAFKKLVLRTFKKRGYTVIPDWRMPTFAFEEHLRSLFEKRSIDCVLDVGANRGQYRNFLRTRVGYRGPIVSFEPIRELAEALKKKAAEEDPNWTVFPLALGNDEGERTFNVMQKNNLSSFFDPDPLSAPPLFETLNVVVRQDTVTMKKLASVFPVLTEKFPFRNAYLKTDTQGYDLEVIRGASGILGEIRALQMEISVIPIYKGMPHYLEVLGEMEKREFFVTGMFPVTKDDFLRIVEYDCVMTHIPSPKEVIRPVPS